MVQRRQRLLLAFTTSWNLIRELGYRFDLLEESNSRSPNLHGPQGLRENWKPCAARSRCLNV
jgi:hypothetical protein